MESNRHDSWTWCNVTPWTLVHGATWQVISDAEICRGIWCMDLDDSSIEIGQSGRARPIQCSERVMCGAQDPRGFLTSPSQNASPCSFIYFPEISFVLMTLYYEIED